MLPGLNRRTHLRDQLRGDLRDAVDLGGVTCDLVQEFLISWRGHRERAVWNDVPAREVPGRLVCVI
jgi:hypothetical protein